MPSLPTISEEHTDLMREIEDLMRSGADEDKIKEKLEEKLNLEDEAEAKLEGYYYIMRELLAHEEAADNEIERLKESRDRAKRAREGLERNVKFFMENVANEDEIYAGPAHFSINQVGGRQKMRLRGDDEEYPQDVKRFRFTVTVEGNECSRKHLNEVRAALITLSDYDGVEVEESVSVLKSRVRDLMSDENDLIEYEPRETRLKY